MTSRDSGAIEVEHKRISGARRGARIGLVALAALAAGVSVSRDAAAVSAEPGLREIPLDPTGATFFAEVIGDEHFDYLRMRDGTVVVLNELSGDYEVAELGLDAGGALALVPSGVLVRDLRGQGGPVDPALLARVDEEELDALWEAATTHVRGAFPIAAGPTPIAGVRRPLLTILLEFTQGGGIAAPGAFTGGFATDIEHWKQTLYGSLPGSVNHYYADMSRGKFSFIRARETHGTANDGIVRIKLPVAHPNSKKDFALIQPYLKEALAKADPFVDFASFDANGDGKVAGDELNVLFVVAGYEASNTTKTPSVWAHALGFKEPITLDGKTLSGYAVVGERQVHKIRGVPTTMPATVGVIVHELGHSAIGLPDLYKGPTPVGAWCVMASGSWGATAGSPAGSTPVAMSAWSRIEAGFLAPTVIEPGTPAHDIPVVQTAGAEFLGQKVAPTIYKIGTSDPDQYFLVENRHNEGYDRGLQSWISFGGVSGGVAIYRIDEARKASQGKIAFMADDPAAPSKVANLYNLEGGRTFTPFTDPSSDDGDGRFTGLSITGLSAAGPIMLARVGYVPFGCNAITASIAEHEIHGRVRKLVVDVGDEQLFLGYRTTGAMQGLGVDKNKVVTLHVEAPGMWSVGGCG
ncbi:M6 family metalloprotease domain-containing protein [Sorangium sp. So ce1024]|uniref:M6 family metalloprotease domain-containing protein n=1 Tax=Sorangium sp. So ce1024 TaxID=3133327 RepID=UPI003F0CFEFC